jgi:hypothetical protein
MSFPTQQAFIHNGDWNEETRKHPAMKWMERYTREQIDARAWASGADPNEWHTSDFTLQKSDGTRREGADKANDALGEIYGPFTGQKHEPTFLVCWWVFTYPMYEAGCIFANASTTGKNRMVGPCLATRKLTLGSRT